MFSYICRWCVIVSIASFTLIAPPLLAQTVEVRVDGQNGSVTTANPPPDGSAWGATAFLYLQDALTYADFLFQQFPAPELVEIWVRGSHTGASWDTYKPFVSDVSWASQR